MKSDKDIKKSDTSVEEKSVINYWELALEAVVATTPIIGPSAAALIRASNESKRASESNDINILNDEAEKQKVELLMAEMQARVAQEMAIAQRIQSAHEVEIEEYYEGIGEGNAGIKAAEGSINVGVGGKGSKVTKRIYRFKDNTDKNTET
ncbi:MAG: hypothetical protein D3905_17230 [Candidatus Electrothrix sp. AS4_5]|nr:hypothetical protein [Candidatus Electrothrix gigas]